MAVPQVWRSVLSGLDGGWPTGSQVVEMPPPDEIRGLRAGEDLSGFLHPSADRARVTTHGRGHTRSAVDAGGFRAMNFGELLQGSTADHGRPVSARFAFYGRVSTDDLQDPTLSLPRQLEACLRSLPDGTEIVAHFYDVDSGRTGVQDRGGSARHEVFKDSLDFPRDGGLPDLMAAARERQRIFDYVVVEGIDRVARATRVTDQVEHELGLLGVGLFCADEGVGLGVPKSTTVLQRGIRKSVAQSETMRSRERARDAYEEHTRQGFSVGKAPYGYSLERLPHPVPAKRAKGETKSRLVLDPVRAGLDPGCGTRGFGDVTVVHATAAAVSISCGVRWPSRV